VRRYRTQTSFDRDFSYSLYIFSSSGARNLRDFRNFSFRLLVRSWINLLFNLLRANRTSASYSFSFICLSFLLSFKKKLLNPWCRNSLIECYLNLIQIHMAYRTYPLPSANDVPRSWNSAKGLRDLQALDNLIIKFVRQSNLLHPSRFFTALTLRTSNCFLIARFRWV